MNRNFLITITATGVAMLAVGLLLGRFLLTPSTSGSGPGREHAEAERAGASHSEEETTWTCSMHPQIQQSEPGQCPICGMDLIPLVNNDAALQGPRELSMSEGARALAEIETSPVVRRFPEVEVRLVGMLDFDETRLRSLSARFPARIDELFVNYTGIRVEKGDHLAVIYSPDLLTAQRELLTALEYDPSGSTARIAREKLRLWDFQPDQIDAIVSSGEARDHLELRAPGGGIVVQKNVKEGDYVKTGDPLFRIADLTRLWLPLEAFESDLPWLRYGQKVEFEVEAFPGEPFEGRVVFIAPTLNRKTRTVGVRVEVSNAAGRLKPGMFARATVFSRIASGGRVIAPELAGKWISPMHPEVVKDGPGKCDVCGMDLVSVESLGYATEADQTAPLVVPTSAVLRTGKRAVVYVSLPDREDPTFEGREITIGPRAGDVFLVLEGLREGEQVVTNGAFKIDSALQILAKPSMMSPSGGVPAPGHNHGGQTAPKTEDESLNQPPATMPSSLSTDEARKLLAPYFELQEALAADDLAKAKSALSLMLETSGHTSGIANDLHEMLAADSLDGIRRPYFEAVSNALASAVRADEDAFEGTLFVKHCPMAYPDRGADWIQATEKTNNPYLGTAMPSCGETTGTLGSR